MKKRLAHTHFTLWTYGLLWVFGAFFSGMQVWAYWSRMDTRHSMFATFVLAGAFIAINLHQLHVYRSIHELDDGLDDTPYRSERFIGTGLEFALRVLIFACLLAAGGKMNDAINELVPDNEWNPIVFYTWTLLVMFVLLITWDAAGLFKDRAQVKAGIPLWDNSIKNLINSNKYSRKWFLMSDLFGLIISALILLMINVPSAAEVIYWCAFFEIPYILVIGLRFWPQKKGAPQDSNGAGGGLASIANEAQSDAQAPA